MVFYVHGRRVIYSYILMILLYVQSWIGSWWLTSVITARQMDTRAIYDSKNVLAIPDHLQLTYISPNAGNNCRPHHGRPHTIPV